MSRLIKRDEAYSSWISELKERYQRSQIKASVAVNTQMLMFYWSLGRDIVDMQAENRYGSGFYAALSKDLRRVLPDARGFSVGNLRYMRRFYELYPTENEKRQQLADALANAENRQQVADDSEGIVFCIPWGHHLLLLDKCKDDRNKALFYVRKSLENNWSRAVISIPSGAQSLPSGNRHNLDLTHNGKNSPAMHE